jgi:hypothetical protein
LNSAKRIVIFAHLIQSASNLSTDASALESSISALESAISALESDIKTLESSSVPWEHSVWVFTVLVVVGVAMELWIIGHEYRDDMEAWALAHFGVLRSPGRPSITKLSVEVGSVLLITFGIMGELGAGIKIASINGALRSKNAELRSKSGQLIALLDQETEQLHKVAGELKSENLKLEAQIAPRRLDLDQQVKIAENCKGFKSLSMGKRIKLVSYSLDTESFVLAEQIVEVLRASGMTVDDEAMSITPMMGNLVFGINVFGSDPELAKKIAEAIGSSGKPIAVGFAATDPTAGTMRVETANSRLPHEATVLVGLKPFDANTANELMRIMNPTVKPTKP